MGINGGRGIVSLGAVLGGAGISTPKDSGFKVRFTGESDITSEVKLTRFLSSIVTGEGSLVASPIDFKTVGTNMTGQGSLVGELGSGIGTWKIGTTFIVS
tara:strand:- start:233 stop:532 length:300 start_codon:yes stop_codon:yes gene_type:complete